MNAFSQPAGSTKYLTYEPTGFSRCGTCPGVITFTPRGEGGFGYDPYFEYLSGETFAEMNQEEKNRISHRAHAMQLMLPYLEEL